MTLGGKPHIAESLAAALDWWREAGVDSDWQDAPHSWLAPAEAPMAEEPQGAAALPAERSPPPAPPPEPLEIPGELESFRQWWLAEPRLDGGRLAGRVAPRGPIGAEVMLLVAEPEREDTDSLLSGPHGRLLLGMLGAMGLAPENAYFASALPRHTPHADWKEAANMGLGAALVRHVALARPRRLIVFGGNILPLFGTDPAQSAAVLKEFNQEDVQIPMLAVRELAAMLERPRWKAGFWRDWLAWTQ